MSKRRQRESAADAQKMAREYISKKDNLQVGATVTFKTTDGRVLVGTITGLEHHVLGLRLKVLSGDVLAVINPDQICE